MIKLSNIDSQTDAQSATNNPSTPDVTAPAQPVAPKPLVAPAHSGGGNEDSQPATLNLQPATCNLLTNIQAPLVPITTPVPATQVTAVIDAKAPRKIRRNGRIACLPRIQRDMVNHMLWNAIPYKNIVIALEQSGYTVTERNISNWATGGYLEWCLAQEHVLQNRLDQDQLLDFLRRDDAPELPEVGLQAAATRLSQVLLQKLSRADDPEAHLDNYSKLVDLLCRLRREIAATQKQRDDSRRSLGPEYDPARVKEVEQISAIEDERFYSDPPPDSTLPKPALPPALPPIPTATLMAEQAREARHDAEIERMKRVTALMKAIKAKASPVTPALPSASLSPSSAERVGQSSGAPLAKEEASSQPSIQQSTIH